MDWNEGPSSDQEQKKSSQMAGLCSETDENGNNFSVFTALWITLFHLQVWPFCMNKLTMANHARPLP
jgi:hypothetical protein